MNEFMRFRTMFLPSQASLHTTIATLLLLLPLPFFPFLCETGAFPLFASQKAFLFSLLLTGVTILGAVLKLRRSAIPLLLAMLMLITAQCISVRRGFLFYWIPSSNQFAFQLVVQAQLLYAVLLLFSSFRLEARRISELTGGALLFISLIISLGVVLQYAYGYSGLGKWFSLPAIRNGVQLNYNRYSGFFSNPNVAATDILLTWPFVYKAPRLRSEILLTITLINIIALILTFSRAAYIGLFFQVLALVVFAKQTPRVFNTIFGSIVAIVVFLWLLVCHGGNFIGRFISIFDVSDRSISNRLHVLTVARDGFLYNPGAGIGLGTFGVLYNRLYKLPAVEYSYFDVHSLVAYLFVELGSFGVIILLLAFLSIAGCCTLNRSSWVQLAGFIPCIFADNPVRNFGIYIILLYSVIYIQSCSALGQIRVRVIGRLLSIVSVGCFIAWILNCSRMPDGYALFRSRIESRLRTSGSIVGCETNAGSRKIAFVRDPDLSSRVNNYCQRNSLLLNEWYGVTPRIRTGAVPLFTLTDNISIAPKRYSMCVCQDVSVMFMLRHSPSILDYVIMFEIVRDMHLFMCRVRETNHIRVLSGS